jgi:acetyltransferase-like isoleucine patch superfamily enzyme
LKLFKLFCYLIYKYGKQHFQERQFSTYTKIATIDANAIITDQAKILNSRGQQYVKIGKNTVLCGDLVTFGTRGEINIGDYCFIGENSKIWSAKSICIGNRVLISYNVNIHDQNAHPLDSNERHKDQINILEGKGILSNKINDIEINIKDDVWIGFNSTILKGVTIGRGAIIGSNTIITSDVPDFAVVVGNPAKIIKYTT